MNRPIHFEIHSSDPAKTNAFFSTIFGWTISTWPGPMEYWIAATGAGTGIDGGIMRSRDGQPRTVNTVEVENLDRMLEAVAKAGGQCVVPRMAIPTVGWLAYCTEPTGNIFGIMQHDPSAR